MVQAPHNQFLHNLLHGPPVNPLIQDQLLFIAFAVCISLCALSFGLLVGYRRGWRAGVTAAETGAYESAYSGGMLYGAGLTPGVPESAVWGPAAQPRPAEALPRLPGGGPSDR